MSKRSGTVVRTREADALRKMREIKGLSVRKVADLLGVSHTLVNHLELGRANIQQDYLQKFLKDLKFSHEEWEMFVGGGNRKMQVEKAKMMEECIFKIRKLSPEKLKLAKSFLQNLVVSK